MTPFVCKTGNTALQERRRSRRYTLRLPVLVWLESTGQRSDAGAERQAWPAVIEDISLTGMRFVAAEPLTVGSSVWLRIRIGSQPQYAKATVRRCTWQRADGPVQFVCGVQILPCPQSKRFLSVISNLLERADALDTSPMREVA
jgi:hypothetical protein